VLPSSPCDVKTITPQWIARAQAHQHFTAFCVRDFENIVLGGSLWCLVVPFLLAKLIYIYVYPRLFYVNNRQAAGYFYAYTTHNLHSGTPREVHLPKNIVSCTQ